MKKTLSYLVMITLGFTFTAQSAEAFLDNTLKLRFGQNTETYDYPAGICKKFGIIRNIVDDLGDDESDEPIFLPNIISKELFDTVLGYTHTATDQRSDFLRTFDNNQKFQELFEALNFLDYQEPEEALFGPFIKKILNDARKLQPGQTTDQQMRKLMQTSSDKLSLLDWFFHPDSGNYGRFTILTHSDLARKIHGDVLRERASLKQTTPKELLRYLEQLAKNPTKKNLLELGVIIYLEPEKHSLNTFGYHCTNFGITHARPAEIANIKFNQHPQWTHNQINLHGNVLKNPSVLSIDICPELHCLHSLNLSNNNIKGAFPPLNLPALTCLILSNNEITSADLTKCPKLKMLDLSNNKLTNFPNLPMSIEILRIQNNKISELCDLPELPGLKKFDIISNELEEVDWYAIAKKLQKLETLNINFNKFPWQKKLKNETEKEENETEKEENETEEEKKERISLMGKAKRAIFATFKKEQSPPTLQKVTL